MKKIIIMSIFSIIVLAAFAQAGVPMLINYQGQLKDDLGNPVPDGLYNINFAIYGSSNGTDLLWESGGRKVNITDGLFSVQLGAISSLPYDLFVDSDSRYLGLTVNSGDEITPRTRFTSTGFAMQALRAYSASSVESNTITGFHVVDSSLSSADISDVPGIASTYYSNAVLLDDETPTPIDSIIITTPAAGYIYLTAKTTINFTTGSAPEYSLGNARLVLSETRNPSIYSGISSFTVVGYSNVNTGIYQNQWFNVSLNDLFTIPAGGTYKYYLVGDQGYNDGTAYAWYVTIVGQYFPVSYGTVEKVIAQPPPDGDYETITTVDNTAPEQKTVTGYKVDLQQLEIKPK